MTRNRDKRFDWMTKFEKEVVRIAPEMRGKVDWNAATFFYNSGLDPVAAAVKAAAK